MSLLETLQYVGHFQMPCNLWVSFQSMTFHHSTQYHLVVRSNACEKRGGPKRPPHPTPVMEACVGGGDKEGIKVRQAGLRFAANAQRVSVAGMPNRNSAINRFRVLDCRVSAEQLFCCHCRRVSPKGKRRLRFSLCCATLAKAVARLFVQ